MASTNQVHKLNVNFGYRKWVTDYSDSLRIQPEGVLYPITQIATTSSGSRPQLDLVSTPLQEIFKE